MNPEAPDLASRWAAQTNIVSRIRTTKSVVSQWPAVLGASTGKKLLERVPRFVSTGRFYM